MKTKIILIIGFFFLLRFFCIPEISFAVTVADLYPAAKVWDAVAKTIAVPAAVEASGSGGVVSRVVTVVLDSATLGSLAGVALGIGSYYAAGAYIDWLMGTTDPPMFYNNSGVLVKLGYVGGPSCVSGYSFVGDFSSAEAAYSAVLSACQGFAAGGGSNNNPGLSTVAGCQVYSCSAGNNNVTHVYAATLNGYSSQPPVQVPVGPNDVARQLVAGLAVGNASAIAAAKAVVDKTSSVYPSNSAVTPSLKGTTYDQTIKDLYNGKVSAADSSAAQTAADTQTPAENADNAANQANSALTQDQLTAALQAAGLTATQIAAAIAAANTAQGTTAINAAIVAALQSQGLSATAIAAAIGAVSAVQGLTQAQAQAAVAAALAAGHLSALEIATAINTTFPGVTATQLAAALVTAGLTATQIAAAIKAANPTLTQDQIQAAVTAALAATIGADVAVPEDIPIVVPDKKSLTGVMQTFLAAINSLPMMQTLHGLTINCGGTSSLCINLPSNLGGNQCFDVGPAVGSINMVGQAMLSITTLFMFVWIFRG